MTAPVDRETFAKTMSLWDGAVTYKGLLGLVLASIVGFFAFIYMAVPHPKTIEAINQNVQRLDTTINRVDDRMEALTREISTLSGEFSAMRRVPHSESND